jgi:hypothetical protein
MPEFKLNVESAIDVVTTAVQTMEEVVVSLANDAANTHRYMNDAIDNELSEFLPAITARTRTTLLNHHPKFIAIDAVAEAFEQHWKWWFFKSTNYDFALDLLGAQFRAYLARENVFEELSTQSIDIQGRSAHLVAQIGVAKKVLADLKSIRGLQEVPVELLNYVKNIAQSTLKKPEIIQKFTALATRRQAQRNDQSIDSHWLNDDFSRAFQPFYLANFI